MNELLVRSLAAIVMAGVALVAAFLGGYFFAILVAVGAGAMFVDWRRLTERWGTGWMVAGFAYALLPGGSSFEKNVSLLGTPPASPAVAKRGTLLFVRNRYIYIISTELAERVTQRSTYQQTTENENASLSTRLTALAGRLVFPPPKPRAP